MENLTKYASVNRKPYKVYVCKWEMLQCICVNGIEILQSMHVQIEHLTKCICINGKLYEMYMCKCK